MARTSTTLHESDVVRLRYVTCRTSDLGLSPIEEPERDHIVMPVRGAFRRHYSRSHDVLADANRALFFAAGRPQRISHPAGGCDDCLVIEVADDVLEPLREAATHALLPMSAIASRALLLRRLHDAFEVEERALEILAALLVVVGRATGPPSGRRPGGRPTDRVEAVQLAFLQHPERKWTLKSAASRVCLSPYHLARLFRAETGLSMHAYLTRARVLRAMDLLLDTKADVTTIAYELAFSSHSHFTNVFRTLTGATPSELRRSASVASRTNLTASLS